MTEQPTILLLDDEPMVALTLKSLLELETSYRVLSFTEPAQALAALPIERCEVIISDYMMPGMDGVTFLKHARQQQPFASRILLTGYADKENAVRAINEAGLYYYIEKPWNNDHLKMVIRNAIERTALFNELDARVSALEKANRDLYDIRKRLIKAFL